MARYRARKQSIKDRDVWSVCDMRSGRIVATYVSENAALSLTHALNVADLSSSIIEFGAEQG